MTERMIKSGDVDICTEAFGDESDTPILLIMGASASMLMWPEELCERLAAAGRFVIRYDNRDTGLSTHYALGEPEYTVEDMADDAVAVLDVYDIDTAHIVGASMGGMITQQVALRHRDRAPAHDHADHVDSRSRRRRRRAFGRRRVGRSSRPEARAAGRGSRTGRRRSERQAGGDRLACVAFFGVLHGPAHPYDEAAMRDIFTREVERDPNFQSSANHQVAIRVDSAVAHPAREPRCADPGHPRHC